MRFFTKKGRKLFLICMIGCMAIPLYAQQNNSLYYMYGLPQSSQLNPATQPKCGFFLTFPSLEVNAGNTAVGFSDILIYKPELDSMVWFLYDENTRGNFMSKIKKNLNVFGEVRLDLVSLGFRVNNTYLSMGMSERIEARSIFPYDLMRMGIEGNIDSIGGTKKSFDFSGFGVNTMYYHEYFLGISRQFNKLTLGIRGKVLFGMANVSTNSAEVYMNDGGPDSYQMRSMIKLNGSIPNLTVYEGAEGKVDSVDFKEIKTESDIRSLLLNRKNMGLAVDLGVVYKPTERVSLSASVLDLGYINWRDNLHSFEQDATYDFKGVYVDLNDSTDIGQALIDTLKDNFTYTNNTDPFKTTLSPKLYAGALFQLTKRIGLGFLTRQQILDKNLHSQYTFSLNLYPANMLNLTVSYTIADQMYDNFGFGFTFKLAFLQAYIMSERIPLYWNWDKANNIPIPGNYKNFNIHTGINFVLGYKHREKKLNRDKPLVDL